MTKFNPLNYPIALTEPARVAPSGWLHHVPFAMYLIDAVRPELLVELGSHHGVSYCAFCQAIKTLGTGTQAYAVDTWQGDDQAGFYGAEVLENLRQHHDPLYGGFSQLLQTTFSEAAHQFSDGSIDLLHIDGCHTYDAVYQDWMEWRPKVSNRGVVLFHDTHLRTGGFEVWKLWEELQEQYPTFDMPYGYGLGVVAVGPDIPAGLRELIELPEDDKVTVIEYFYQLGKRVSAAEDRRALHEVHGYEIRGLQDQISGYQELQVKADEHYRQNLTNFGRQHENDLNTLRQALHSKYENDLLTLTHTLQTEYESQLDQRIAEQQDLMKQISELALDNRESDLLLNHQQFHIEQLELELDSVKEHAKRVEHQFASAQHYALMLEHQMTAFHNTRAWSMIQRWYRWKRRLMPDGSRLERLYHLLMTSQYLLRKEGPVTLTKRLYRWTFKGERQSFMPAVEPPNPAPELLAMPEPAGELPPLTAPVYMNVVFPTSKLPEQTRHELEQLVEQYVTPSHRYLSILNWTADFDLSEALTLHALFVPPLEEDTLPYLDGTADLVVIRGHERLDEARRVAKHGVICLEEDGSVTNVLIQAVETTQQQLPSVSLVLPSFNHRDYTNHCLEQMVKTIPSDMDVEIIVVDDCSTEEGVYEEIKEWETRDPRIQVLQNPQNMGYLMTCKFGASKATKDIVVTLNNDILPQEGWVQALARTFVDFPDAGVVGGMLIFPDGHLQEAGAAVFNIGNAWNVGRLEDPDSPEYNFVRKVDYVSGALLATPRWLWNQIGGYDERFRPIYYEDTDYCFAVRAAGYEIYFQPDCRVIHFEGVTSGTDPSKKGTLKHYQALNHEKFLEKWKDMLEEQPSSPPDVTVATVLRTTLVGSRTGTKRVLICAPLMPEFDRESGSRRFAHFVDMFQALGWSVTLLIQNPNHGERYTHLLRQRGVAVFGGYPYFTNPEMLLENGHFDLVMGVFWEFGEYLLKFVEKLSPAPKLIVDTVDLHFVRNVRGAFVEGEDKGLDADQGENIVRELNVYGQADGVLTVSEKEAHMLNEMFIQRPNAFCIPDMESLGTSPIPYEERRGILFVGNFRHPPNIQAFDYLMQDILPLLELDVLRDHPLYIVGNDMQRFLGKSAQVKIPNVHMVGWVPSVIPYIEASRITIVPLKVGAGTKRKLLQALMVGTPSVSTVVGVEGMNLEHGKHVLVANTASDFAQSITTLLYDKPLWHSIAAQGRELIQQYNSQEIAMAKFETALQQVLGEETVRISQPVRTAL
ncbi:MAG: class I SAM-dependent methyltransferase [Anaerolineae bacterium]|nr:class I SAM-dependent methyltransferase [Anaerolineae bacterium]